MAFECYAFDTVSYRFDTDLRRIFASNNTDYGFKNRETAILPDTIPPDARGKHADRIPQPPEPPDL